MAESGGLENRCLERDRGFESYFLRHNLKRIYIGLERCQSGRMGLTANQLCAQAYLGFESLSLRHLALYSKTSNQPIGWFLTLFTQGFVVGFWFFYTTTKKYLKMVIGTVNRSMFGLYVPCIDQFSCCMYRESINLRVTCTVNRPIFVLHVP